MINYIVKSIHSLTQSYTSLTLATLPIQNLELGKLVGSQSLLQGQATFKRYSLYQKAFAETR